MLSDIQFPVRRLIVAAGFAVAVAAAPAIAFVTAPPSVAQCPAGEETDTFTGICVPHLVPNSPFGAIPGNPDVPAVGGIPCTGTNTGQCIGLAEEAQAQGP